MKEKTGIDEKEVRAEGTKAPMFDLADQAMKNYEQAVRTGLKLQQEAGQWWSGLLNQSVTAQDLQKRFTNVTEVANKVMPTVQKRMEEVLDLVEKNTQTGGELVKKAVEAAQTPVIADSQSQWIEFWTSSLGAIRSNTEALTQIHNRTIDSWIDFVRQNTEVTQIRVPKTA